MKSMIKAGVWLALLAVNSAFGSALFETEQTFELTTTAEHASAVGVTEKIQCSTTAWGKVAEAAGVTVTYQFNGGATQTLASGTTEATLDWMPEQFGTYTFTHEPGNLTATIVVKTPTQVALEEAFGDDATVTVTINPTTHETNHLVTITSAISRAVVLPENLDPVNLDLAGQTLTGTNGVSSGRWDVAGTDGGSALVIGAGTSVTVTDSAATKGSITGGNGGSGNPNGLGAPAIGGEGTYTADGVTLVNGTDGKLILPPVTFNRIQQRYPWNGKVDVDYTVSLEDLDRSLAYGLTLTFTAGGHQATTNLLFDASTEGAQTFVFDGGADFAGLADAEISVNAKLFVHYPGVQLWKNGPYWAESNVGATEPKDPGLYFWWGDTLGYKQVGGKWQSSDGSVTDFSFTTDNCPTYGLDDAALVTQNWTDSSGNLLPEHDAAAVHLGSSWRMPTGDEISALLANCVASYSEEGSVGFMTLTGKGDYAGRSIVLPVRSHVIGNAFSTGKMGYYLSSTRKTGNSTSTEGIMIKTYVSYRTSDIVNRSYGTYVRPVLSLDTSAADIYEVTETASFDTQATRSVQVVYGQSLTFQCSTNAWGETEASETATVSYTLDGGAPTELGSSATGTITWEPTVIGEYVFTHAPGGLTATFTVTRPAEELALEAAFRTNAIIRADYDAQGQVTNYTVSVTNDITGKVVLPANLGRVTVDIAGWALSGAEGEAGSPTQPGTAGEPALVVSGGTQLVITDSGEPKGSITGGKGGDGHPPAAGAVAIDGAYETVGSVTVTQGSQGTAINNTAVEDALKAAFGTDAAVAATYDADGNPSSVTVTLLNGIAHTVTVPDWLGTVTIDLKGKTMTGADGAAGSASAAGGDGQSAIEIVHEVKDGAATKLIFVDSASDADADILGGNGGNGNGGGNGAAAIAVADGVREGVAVSVGTGVSVKGGDGGNGLGEASVGTGAAGGNGGAGIAGTVETCAGVVTGGKGGDGADGESNGGVGGNGGAGYGTDGGIGGNGGNGGFGIVAGGTGGTGGAGATPGANGAKGGSGKPTVNIVKAQQRYPWNGKIDIDFTAEGPGAKFVLVVTLAAGGQKWTASSANLAGDVTLADGMTADQTRRITWNAAADCGTAVVDKNATLTVTTRLRK